MELLRSLGVDSTVWIHLACFVVAYLAMSTLVFRPYLHAFQERERRTVGSEEDAIRLIEEAHALNQAYEQKAKSMNVQIKSIYDQRRAEAAREYDRAAQAARDEASKLLTASRARIAADVQAARRALLADLPAVSAAISTKLAGKELH